MPGEDVTPIRQQYLDIKRLHPNEIVFFRLGDFYETFDEDAKTAARELDIVLTSRNVAKGSRVPMAGIPFHAAETYIARLVQKGLNIAICEQVGTEPVNGLFERRVTRVITPGTLVEPGLLQGDASNFLAAVVLNERDHADAALPTGAVAYADISTGEFGVSELAAAAMRAELLRLKPAETLFPEGTVPTWVASESTQTGDAWPGKLQALPKHRFELRTCSEALQQHFQVGALDGLGLAGKHQAVRAAGAILQYIGERRPETLRLLVGLRVHEPHEFMTVDASTRRNLEIDANLRGGRDGSLLSVLDAAETAMGRRLMRRWISQPLLDVVAIELRQNAVQELVTDSMLRAQLRSELRPLPDLERITNRIVAGLALPRDLDALRDALRRLAAVESQLREAATQSLPELQLPAEPARLLHAALSDEPPSTLQGSGIIRRGFSAELDGVMEASQHARGWIANLEGTEREKTGLKTLKVGYNKVFGYYIEISSGAAGNAPKEYIRKQTLVNAERFITPELKEYEALVLNADAQIHQIELRLFTALCEQLSEHADALLLVARTVAELDVFAAWAEVAALGGYCRPEVHAGAGIEIRAGRHPVVERSLKGGRFVPNDLIFERGEHIRVLTGPNMAGKSTFLRQNALIVLMAQIGSFVPAAEAKIGVVDRIFTRIGAQDEIQAGQSTFMVEMIEAANILHHATVRSLLILDELGRGTSTYDGVSIAWAVVEYIHNHPRLRSKTLFATHYHELTQLAGLLPGVRNYSVAVTETDGQVVFLHQIVPGGADKSYGIHVAQMAGLPGPVVQRANEIMAELERSAGSVIRTDSFAAQQLGLFPETNTLLKELSELDLDTLPPLQALNKLFEWRRRYAQ